MIDAVNGFGDTDAFVFHHPLGKPPYLAWQQQIQVVLCYCCTHSFTSIDSMNFIAVNDSSVWKRY